MTCGNGGSTPDKLCIRLAEVRLRPSLVVIFASIAAAVLWIEHGQHVVADAPTPTELAARAAARACPDSESVPYSENCIAFMQGDRVSPQRWQASVVESTTVTLTEVPGPACPANNENVPYSATCIRFMSGWSWRPS